MSWTGVAALRAEREEVLAVLRSLSPDEWAAPSACPGWTVHDVASHLATTYSGIAGTYIWKALRSGDIEATNDDVVDVRRAWPPEKVVAEYETWSRRILRLFGAAQVPPLSKVPFPLAELGRYPLAIFADALVFDHHCHLRLDVLAPRGPVDRPHPPVDEPHMRAVLAWMLAGLPQMSRDRLTWLDRPVRLELTGPGGGAWIAAPATRRVGRVTVTPADGHRGDATVTSPAVEFPVWGTHRRPWRESPVEIAGDAELATRFLDSVRIV